MTTVLDQRPGTSADGTPAPRPERDDGAADGVRRRRRRRLLAWSALPVVAMLAVGAKLVFTSWATDRGIAAYGAGSDDGGRYDRALQWFDRAAWINVYEREIPAFDRGDALVAAGDLPAARLAFEEALGLARGARRCTVVVNLALTIEMQGDAAAAVVELDGQRFYVEAGELIDDNGECMELTTAVDDGQGDRLARALDRLDGKIIQQVTTRVPRATADQAVGPDPEDPSDDDVDELEQQMEENAETRSEGREINESIDRALPPRDGPSW